MGNNRAVLKEALERLPLMRLYQIRGEQYPDRVALIEDILDADDSTLQEVVEYEFSLLKMLEGRQNI